MQMVSHLDLEEFNGYQLQWLCDIAQASGWRSVFQPVLTSGMRGLVQVYYPTSAHVDEAQQEDAAATKQAQSERGRADVVQSLQALTNLLQSVPKLTALMASRPALAPLLNCIEPICR